MIERLSTDYNRVPFVHAFAKINEIIDALNSAIDPTGRPTSVDPVASDYELLRDAIEESLQHNQRGVGCGRDERGGGE